jgi:hypothetical protein
MTRRKLDAAARRIDLAVSSNCPGVAHMLIAEQRAFLLEGPSRFDRVVKGASIRRLFDGPAVLRELWRRNRAELMAACPPGVA